MHYKTGVRIPNLLHTQHYAKGHIFLHIGCMSKTSILLGRTDPLVIHFSKRTLADGVFQGVTAFKIPQNDSFVAFFRRCNFSVLV